MKDYKEVVESRYNEEDVEKSIYAEDQPIGKYTRFQIFSCFREIFKTFLKSKKEDASLLDVGCGYGGMLKFFEKEGFKPGKLVGVDLSEKRIQIAKTDSSEIRFIVDNGLSFQLNESFDVITSLDMFSHIIDEEDIVSGLKNIRNHLNENGIFIWYDICSNDHFDSPDNVDSWGFSLEQMHDLGKKAGLKPIGNRSVFRQFFGRYHSAYQAKRVPTGLLRFLEKVLPGKPGNLAVVFRK